MFPVITKLENIRPPVYNTKYALSPPIIALNAPLVQHIALWTTNQAILVGFLCHTSSDDISICMIKHPPMSVHPYADYGSVYHM